jgi:hypothetical protein
MKFDVFNEADFTPNASADAADSSPDVPMLPDKVVEETVESEVTHEASQDEPEAGADDSADAIVEQSNEDVTATTSDIEASPDQPEAVADTVNEDVEQDVSDWEKDDVSDIASLADPSETEPSEQLETEGLPYPMQEEEKAGEPHEGIDTVCEDDIVSIADITEPVETDDMTSSAPPITDPVAITEDLEHKDTAEENDKVVATYANSAPIEAKPPATKPAAVPDSKDLQDGTITDELLASTAAQEVAEAESTPEPPETPVPTQPEEDATENDAGVPHVDEPKPAESEDLDSTQSADAAAAPDDAVNTVEATGMYMSLCVVHIFVLTAVSRFHFVATGPLRTSLH